MGLCGLVCDHTLSYVIVLANGDLIQASADEHSDLFWALKGGGGNFGVVTSITYRIYPISTVVSGMVLHPVSQARDVLRFYRDFVMSGLPDELIVYAATLTTPDGSPVITRLLPRCATGGSLVLGRPKSVLSKPPKQEFGPPEKRLGGFH